MVRICVSQRVFVDLEVTPRSFVHKAADTVKEQHTGISVEFVTELVSSLTDAAPSDCRNFRIEISTNVFLKYAPTEDWEERVGQAIMSVRDAKQTFERRLKALVGFAEILKDVYGLEPIEGGN